MDVHVPYAITIALRMRGVDVLTAQEDNSQELEDAALVEPRNRPWPDSVYSG